MADNSDKILHFNEYFKVIRNRLWVIFTIFALTVLSGFYVTEEVLPKVYSATAQVQIEPRGELLVQGIGQNGSTERNFDPIKFQAEFEIMQSPDMLSPIITDLQLDKTWAQRVFKSSRDKLPMQDALGYMDRILKLDYKKGTNIVSITVSSEVPSECSDIANHLADRYKQMRDNEEDQRSRAGTDALQDQIKQQQAVVDEKRDAVETMRHDLSMKRHRNRPGRQRTGPGGKRSGRTQEGFARGPGRV